MQSIDTMMLAEIDATVAALRARRNALKVTRTQVDRQVAGLLRRKERLLGKVAALDAEILQLRGVTGTPVTTADAPIRRRGRRPKQTPTLT